MWNPETYDQFKNERSAPFFDLIKLVNSKPNLSVIDLGCGTGELTSKLLDFLEKPQIIGIDSSEEMLKKARKFEAENLKFEHRDIECQLELEDNFDLVFSNAALQWIQNHEFLFPKIVSKIKRGGQLCVQIPSNHTFVVHPLLRKIISQEPFKSASNNFTREIPVLKIEDYAEILYQNGGNEITIYEKVYPHILENGDAVYSWATGTAMIPYIESLPEELREEFKDMYRREIRNYFQASPVFYPFKRILISAKF